ncbi:NAD-dependent epimerase/dehydratase family protein [Mesobacillus thioparans]|uniref:NAD-dependent epimerase/dehydratase family protein n=1 Tax=Mesobacillus thioparans TaxID=370439 RepID=UPI0039EF62B1
MKIIVTGGAGFIGCHLSRKLVEEGNEVLVIDALHPYYSKKRKIDQLTYIGEAGTFRYEEKNLLDDEEEVQKIFLEFQADCVVHLAALPGVSYSLEAPGQYVDYDVKATVNVLKFSGESNVKHVLYASSSSVYGEQANEPLSEDMAAGKVISPYAAAKYGAEAFCHAFASMYQYDMTILRFFTVYGPWGRPDMAITKFIERILNGEEITVFGNRTSRDYTYIDDIIEGISAAIQKARGTNIINLGSSMPVSIEDLLAALAKHFPEMKIQQAGFRQGDVTSTWADTTKAKELLDYRAKVPFEEGLARTVKWAVDYYGKE